MATKQYDLGLVFGNFFILHPGHVRFLRFAATVCEKLVIGVHDTRPSDRYPTTAERIANLKALSLSHEVVLLERPLEFYLELYRPSAIIKGNEYRYIENPERTIIARWGGEIVFASGDSNYTPVEDFSSNDAFGNNLQLVRPSSFIRRNDCDPDTIRSIITRFRGLKVAVIGDLIVDEYIECEALGMSREDPTIVVSPVGSKQYLGGAGIVAAHAKALGAHVTFMSLVSNDAAGVFAKSALNDIQVRFDAVCDVTRTTTLKRRYRCSGKTLLRVNHLTQEEPSPEIQSLLIKASKESIKNVDCLVLSDFSYGSLTQAIVDEVIELANKLNLVVSADSQSSSQTGDSSRFKGVSLICATEYEARSALRQPAMGLSALGAELLKRSKSKNLLLKLGAAGVVLLKEGESPADLDRLPALNPTPVDVAGAGDSMLTAATMALTVGGSLAQAAYIGSIAAAIQVSRVGNVPLTYDELNRALS